MLDTIKKRLSYLVPGVGLLILCSFVLMTDHSFAQGGVQNYSTISEEQILPDTEENFADLDISDLDREAVKMQLMENRENLAAEVNSEVLQAESDSNRSVVESRVPQTQFLENQQQNNTIDNVDAANSFYIGTNRRNDLARSISGTLAEPAAVNEGAFVFYMGNTYASYSTNGGITYSRVNIPNGPSTAPIACCDPDVVHDEARQVTFYSMLYLNSTANHGAVRIWVRPWIPGGGGPYSQPTCSYTIQVGTNVVPDYPHLGLSNNYLYLSTNNVGSSWQGSQMRRFNIDQMSKCQATSTRTFTWNSGSQRVFVPIEGAERAMHWGMLNNTTSFRIFEWKETSNSVSSVSKSISRSYHSNPDCRGGTGNNDFIERSTAYSIVGFRMRGARAINPQNGDSELWFWWNSSNGGSRPQAFIRTVRFRQSNKSLVGQPDIWNPSTCFGFPAASTNSRGAIGLSLAAGGKKGGGGTAARGYVGIIDDFNFPRVNTVYLTANGTHNRSDGRYGDYFTVRPFSPCDLAFTATNYALLNGNTSASHVNARYINFMRERDKACYLGWRIMTR